MIALLDHLTEFEANAVIPLFEIAVGGIPKLLEVVGLEALVDHARVEVQSDGERDEHDGVSHLSKSQMTKEHNDQHRHKKADEDG